MHGVTAFTDEPEQRIPLGDFHDEGGAAGAAIVHGVAGLETTSLQEA